MKRIAFSIASFFWVFSPIIFLIGRLTGIWNFQKDILIFGVLMGLCFLVCLVHAVFELLDRKNETWAALNARTLAAKIRSK